ncbi:MAG: FMN-binding protein [Clostridia bacterium]|nr:FMN-binding protein [Clostridia bacterium]
MNNRVIVKNIVVLTVIALVSVFLLSLVYQVTKDPIAKAAAEKQAAAYLEMYDDSAELAMAEDAAIAIEESKAMLEASFNGAYVTDAMVAREGETVLGYAVTAVSPKGYGGAITMALRVDLTDDGAVINGMRVLEQSETAGFGNVCSEESYWGQYTDAAKTDAVIISGATYTTTAINDALQAAMKFAVDYADRG